MNVIVYSNLITTKYKTFVNNSVQILIFKKCN